jgi:hypothetical protein
MKTPVLIFNLLFLVSFSLPACRPEPTPLHITPTAAQETYTAPFPSMTPISGEVEVLVYFVSTGRFAIGIEPYEEPVLRLFPAEAYLPEAVLNSYFEGPTDEERDRGLDVILSGFTGLRQLDIRDGTGHVFLDGTCASQGAAYNVSQLIMVNLFQFEEIEAVKIYDERGETGEPDRPGNSIPFCLEP